MAYGRVLIEDTKGDLFALGLPIEVGGFPLRGVLYLLLALLLVVALWALHKLSPTKPRKKRKRA